MTRRDGIGRYRRVRVPLSDDSVGIARVRMTRPGPLGRRRRVGLHPGASAHRMQAWRIGGEAAHKISRAQVAAEASHSMSGLTAAVDYAGFELAALAWSPAYGARHARTADSVRLIG